MSIITQLRFPFLFLFFILPAALSALESLSVNFYSEKLDIQYDPGFVIDQQLSVEEHRIVRYYQTLKKTNYLPLLQQLEAFRNQLTLNDWLYFELLQTTMDQIFSPERTLQGELTAWFLLAESGFDVRLAYIDNHVFLYIYTNEELYEVPMIEEGGKTFASLSGLLGKKNERPSLYLLNFVPNAQGRSFSFYLRQLPQLTPEIVEKSYSIDFRDTTYQLTFQSDRTVVRLMQNYPLISEEQYFNVPFSVTARQSLLPQLRRLLDDKTPRQAIELLVSFTRTSFQYMEDKLHFGFSKPMIPEEVFHYPFSDCEDRSALFYSLVRELLDLPMVIIAFQDHLTIGVAIPGMDGEAVSHEGKKYYICDPTGPAHSSQIGRFPKGYETKPFDIIGKYN